MKGVYGVFHGALQKKSQVFSQTRWQFGKLFNFPLWFLLEVPVHKCSSEPPNYNPVNHRRSFGRMPELSTDRHSAREEWPRFLHGSLKGSFKGCFEGSFEGSSKGSFKVPLRFL